MGVTVLAMVHKLMPLKINIKVSRATENAIHFVKVSGLRVQRIS